MIKRPACLAAVIFLSVQAVLTGGLRLAKDLKPSALETYAEEGETLTVQGTVSRREEKPEYQVYYLTDNQVRLKNQIIKESKLLVYFKQNESQKEHQKELQKESAVTGNVICVSGTITFFQEASNPGNFDQKFYYQKQGIHAMVWAEQVEVTDAGESFFKERLARLRSRWKSLLVECLGEYYGNSMSAILLGDKSELDSDLKELYQKSGIGHVLAISGLHMSFLGIGVYRILRKTGLGFLASGGTGILFLLFYTFMIGGGVSGLRALIMFIVRIGADISGRDYDMLTSLSLAAAGIVFWQPLYLLDAGFLLSFGAILGITILSPVLESCHAAPGMLCAGLSIHLAILPVLLYFYFEFPVYSLLLNLLVVPLMSAVLGIGILGSVLSLIWLDGGKMLLQICKAILWLYEQAGGITMKLPFGRVVPGQPGIVWTVVYYGLLFGGCLLISFRRKSRKKGKTETGSGIRGTENPAWKEDGAEQRKEKIAVRTAVLCLPLVFCLLCWCGHGKPGELNITMLDVGQGDGLYIRTPSGSRYFIDGGSTDVGNVGKYRIEPFLKSQGIRTLDFVFISHGDADHINGIQEMLQNQELGIRITTLVLPPGQVLDDALRELAATALENGTDVVTIHAGQTLEDGGMALTCLAPSDAYAGEIGNASSMVLELRYKKFDMLLTGDLEGEGERELTDSGRLMQYDVLKVAHHGSKNSTGEDFLMKAAPKIALISAGRDNLYGHPHAETIRRLEETGSSIFCTQDGGAVMLKTDGEQVEVKTYLQTVFDGFPTDF